MNSFADNLANYSKRALAGVAIAISLAACAGAPKDQAAAEANDPYEGFNRTVFQFNRGLDFWIGRPVATAYNDLVPDYGKDRVKNVIDNLREPVNTLNNMFQGQWGRAWNNVQRFAVNSTVGVLGIWQVLDVEPAPEDFGQTLAVWGSGEGPYLVLPFVGPSNPRDAVGLVGDAVMDPFNIAAWATGAGWLDFVGPARFTARAVDSRARVLKPLDEIERTSVDYYATIRSLYRQNRNDEIRNGKPGQMLPLPDISFEFEDDKTPSGKQAAVAN